MAGDADDRRKLGVRCPKCWSTRFRVIFTRHRPGSTVRVKECKACGHRVRTRERMDSCSG